MTTISMQMDIVLCTPYSIGPQYVQGGIVVWAQNIVGYYNSQSSDVNLHVVPFDRTGRTMEETRWLKRAWGGITEYWKPIQETKKCLKRGGYDVLHLCTSASLSLLKDIIVLKAAKRKGAQTVVHFHFGRIPELAEFGNWEWKLLLRVVRLADGVITMDMRSFNTLKKQGFEHIRFLPNPLSTNIIQQIKDEANGVSREERKLCFVGHVIPSKGIYELVEACKGISGIKLHIIGKAAPEFRDRMIELSGNAEWLVFEGEVNHQQVLRELLSSSVFVLPTYTEGFPNVILESMACGCAIATTQVGAIPEMLNIASEKPCGLCCDPKDVEGLRRNILFFLDNPDEAIEYGKRAMKRVNKMYSMPIVWGQLIGIWREIIKV